MSSIDKALDHPVVKGPESKKEALEQVRNKIQELCNILGVDNLTPGKALAAAVQTFAEKRASQIGRPEKTQEIALIMEAELVEIINLKKGIEGNVDEQEIIIDCRDIILAIDTFLEKLT
jgi:hypothetical protein